MLDTENAESGCGSPLCSDYSMRCGATISIRLTDPDTGELLYRESGEALSLCVSAPSNESLCSLQELALQLFEMPQRTVRIEVAMWNQDQVKANNCPSPARFELFDVTGRPQPNYHTPPAFAGAAYYRIGHDSDITVPLSCPNPGLLNVNTCEVNLATEVRAYVTDMGTMRLIRDQQAASIAVAMGETRKVSDDLGGFYSVLEADDDRELILDRTEATPVFKASIVSSPFGVDGKLACSTTHEGVAQATTTVFCEEIAESPSELTLRPVLIRKTTVDRILLAMELDEFPETGMVIGRVVNEGLTPYSGVVVTPSEGEVRYLNADLTNVEDTLTSDSGYFVATNVPAGATWSAAHFGTQSSSEGSPRGGIIEGKVSAVIIRMVNDVLVP